MERRRCNHHTLDEPLSTLECFTSVIDPKRSLTNKNRYVVASQEEEVRRYCRGVRGVPLVYVKRSVMIMEPMAEKSVHIREGLEKSKFRSGLRGRTPGPLGKRKREEDDGDDSDTTDAEVVQGVDHLAQFWVKKKKKLRGIKGPNPLSIKKPRTETIVTPEGHSQQESRLVQLDPERESVIANDMVDIALNEAPNPPAKSKRKRKHKSKQIEDVPAVIDGTSATSGLL